MPLIVNDELFGLIDIYDTRPRSFSEYLNFLRSLGMGLAGAFASTLLLEQLEHRTAVQREIVELGALAAQGGELGPTARHDRRARTGHGRRRRLRRVRARGRRAALSGERRRSRARREAVGDVVRVADFPVDRHGAPHARAVGRREPRRPSRHRRRARRLRGMGLTGVSCRSPCRQATRSWVRRRVRHQRARLRRVPRLPPQRRADHRQWRAERAAARGAHGEEPGSRRARRARSSRHRRSRDVRLASRARRAGDRGWWRPPAARSSPADGDGSAASSPGRTVEPSARPMSAGSSTSTRFPTTSRGAGRGVILVVTGPTTRPERVGAAPLRGDRVAQRHPSSPSRRGAARRPARGLRPPRA